MFPPGVKRGVDRTSPVQWHAFLRRLDAENSMVGSKSPCVHHHRGLSAVVDGCSLAGGGMAEAIVLIADALDESKVPLKTLS